MNGTLLLFAFILDLLLGDPRWLPHPVRWMGRGIVLYERFVRWIGVALLPAGIALALGLPLLVWGCAFGLLWALGQVSPYLRWGVEVFLVYQCLSLRGLYDETRKVYSAITAGDLQNARANLAMVVGRDTAALDEPEICRAVVETVAEGTVDGIVSPVFYAAIGGAPLALMFKAASTLDSMVGYRNERYKQFGWASARLDDLANLLPARLVLFIVPLAAMLLRMNPLRCWKTAWRDRYRHTSPNAAHAEAAFAGALGVQLGGTNAYQGVISVKEKINQEGRPAQVNDIPHAWRLMFASAGVFLVFFLLFNRMNYV